MAEEDLTLETKVANYLIASWEYPDPFPLFAELREAEPVHFNRILNMWVVTDFDEARKGLRNRKLLRKPAADQELAAFSAHPRGARTEAFLRNTLLNRDGEEHTRIRNLVAHAFTPQALTLWTSLIEETVEEILDSVEGQDEIEFMSQVGYPLPEKVICRMLGIPHERHSDFDRWTYVITGINYAGAANEAAVERAIQAGEEYGDYLRTLVAERRATPGDDLVTVLIQAEENDDRLTEDEIISTIMSLVTAGHGTTAMLAGNAILALMKDRKQWDALIADPSMLPNAIQEFLRFDPPARSLPRVAVEDVEIGGKTIKAGDRILFPLMAANHDGALCPFADQFDISRTPTPHIAFGMGPHSCLGSPVAKVQIQTLFEGIVRRLQNIELAVDPADLTYQDVWQRGLNKLPLRRVKTAVGTGVNA